MSRREPFKLWSAASPSASGPELSKGAKIVLIWFGLCVAVATAGTRLTAEIPAQRAQTQIAQAQ